MKAYFERQINWGVLGGCVGFIVYMTFDRWGNISQTPVAYCIAFFNIIIQLLFWYKRDTHIDDTHIEVVYGVGVSKKKIAIDKIYSVSIVKFKWYQGFGLWMHAIELKFRGSNEINQTAQIYTKDVERLKQAIEARL